MRKIKIMSELALAEKECLVGGVEKKTPSLLEISTTTIYLPEFKMLESCIY